ncbi:hypothetical protein [Streptomyces sp. NBC_01497]|uniref:hypothetical protein n=1 Tax=Streptomyces sp. NBC_01497 TaxID=2903885 RepID=UPI002E3323AA|nr:hypothetical protein [Streptomyces sp. NBC_01497]
MLAMTWQLAQFVEEFHGVAGAFLDEEATLCTMLLGVGGTVRLAGPYTYDPMARAPERGSAGGMGATRAL